MMRLRFTRYRVAERAWRIARNRYYAGTCCAQTIGVDVVTGAYAYGVTWRVPRAPSLAHDREFHQH